LFRFFFGRKKEMKNPLRKITKAQLLKPEKAQNKKAQEPLR